ncbi:hypothetical protein [Jiangella asiatica]|uniref:Uncharacterized protein n=1 Tax=Jiangella asiatica TaxID=2530372 RepID=A0A4R5CS91_9ACTN|nr:hypothetical protein [Jiangella asiatica]TDE03442.1 hypothetical protein E1269_20605 [Jiangella asiatica]
MSADDQREQRPVLDLDALERMREAAETTGDWYARIHDRGHSWLVEGCSEWERAATCDHESDARLIAAMWTALPDLIAAARERDAARERLGELEHRAVAYAAALDAAVAQLGHAHTEHCHLTYIACEAARWVRDRGQP